MSKIINGVNQKSSVENNGTMPIYSNCSYIKVRNNVYLKYSQTAYLKYSQTFSNSV